MADAAINPIFQVTAGRVAKAYQARTGTITPNSIIAIIIAVLQTLAQELQTICPGPTPTPSDIINHAQANNGEGDWEINYAINRAMLSVVPIRDRIPGWNRMAAHGTCLDVVRGSTSQDVSDFMSASS